MRKSTKVFADGFRIAMAYIGTVIGAGFATGQEILQFFTRYGYSSFWGILISTAMFIFMGRSILLYSKKWKSKSYASMAEHIFGGAAPLVNFYLGVTFVLICGAMFAGAGALFEEQWGISYLVGAIVTAVFTLLVTLRGVKGILTINTIIVPCLIVFSVLVFIYVLRSGLQPALSMKTTPGQAFHLVRTGVTYASFNLVLSIGVLAPMGGQVKDERTLYIGSSLGGAILGLLLAMGNYTLLSHFPEVFHREIPQMVIVSQMGKTFIAIYVLVIWAEIFTTAIGNLFAIYTMSGEKNRVVSALPAIGATIIGLLICLLGFSNIVAWFYPVLGIIGFALSAMILVQTFRRSR